MLVVEDCTHTALIYQVLQFTLSTLEDAVPWDNLAACPYTHKQFYPCISPMLRAAKNHPVSPQRCWGLSRLCAFQRPVSQGWQRDLTVMRTRYWASLQHKGIYIKYLNLNDSPARYIMQGHILKALDISSRQAEKLGISWIRKFRLARGIVMLSEVGGLKGRVSCFERCYFESSHEQSNCLPFHLQCLASCSMKYRRCN